VDPIHLLIADDHPMFRKGMRALLTSLPDVEVVGEATSGSEVTERAALLQPDIILMDLQMPGGGIEATRQVLHASPNIRILVVTMFQDDDSVFAALRAGARGYILKDADEDEMVSAIRAVGRGEAIFSPAVATRVLAFFAAPHPAMPKEVFPMLTERERTVRSFTRSRRDTRTPTSPSGFRSAARPSRTTSRTSLASFRWLIALKSSSRRGRRGWESIRS
jgi:DNA-binding NarL/FixJ family response regulator